MWLVAWGLILLVLIRGVQTIDYDHYDAIPDVIDTFQVECGSRDQPTMTVWYHGEAHAVYAPEAPTKCRFEHQGVMGFFLDALQNSDCPIEVSTAPSLMMLAVVAQATELRQVSDDIVLLTCNYEHGGSEDSVSTTEHLNIPHRPRVHYWNTMPGQLSESEVYLGIFNTTGHQITQASLGSYIQLRAYMTKQGDEQGLRMWNCRAYSGDKEYYFIHGGCGDGFVVATSRGFFARAPSSEEQAHFADKTITRVARSFFFKAFVFKGSEHVQFECQYAVCRTLECDGSSCEVRRNMGRSGRRRRHVGSNQEKSLPVSETLPKVRSAPLWIRKPDENMEAHVDYYGDDGFFVSPETGMMIGRLIANTQASNSSSANEETSQEAMIGKEDSADWSRTAAQSDNKVELAYFGLVVFISSFLMLILLVTTSRVCLRVRNQTAKRCVLHLSPSMDTVDQADTLTMTNPDGCIYEVSFFPRKSRNHWKLSRYK